MGLIPLGIKMPIAAAKEGEWIRTEQNNIYMCSLGKQC